MDRRVSEPADVDPDIRAISEIAKPHRADLGRRRQHLRIASAGAPIGTGGRYRHALGYQVSRCHSDCWQGSSSPKKRSIRSTLFRSERDRWVSSVPSTLFLLGIGIKTLDLRMREQSRTALRVAEWLEQHPRCVASSIRVCQVIHIMNLQAANAGCFWRNAIVSNSKGISKPSVSASRLSSLVSVSLGAVESLIEQPATMSHASYAAEDRKRFGIADSLIRLSIWLEDAKTSSTTCSRRCRKARGDA